MVLPKCKHFDWNIVVSLRRWRSVQYVISNGRPYCFVHSISSCYFSPQILCTWFLNNNWTDFVHFFTDYCRLSYIFFKFKFLKLSFPIPVNDQFLWSIWKKTLQPILCRADFKTYMYMIGYVHKIFRIGQL